MERFNYDLNDKTNIKCIACDELVTVNELCASVGAHLPAICVDCVNARAGREIMNDAVLNSINKLPFSAN